MVRPMTWFGSRWNAPLNESCEQVATPTGTGCSWCGEPIEWWASGILMDHLSNTNIRRRPQHLECHLRSGLGSFGHQLGLCSCGSNQMEDPPGLTVREAARATVYILFGWPAGGMSVDSLVPSEWLEGSDYWDMLLRPDYGKVWDALLEA